MKGYELMRILNFFNYGFDAFLKLSCQIEI